MRMREYERVRVNHKIGEWLQMRSNPPYIGKICMLGLAVGMASCWASSWVVLLDPPEIGLSQPKVAPS